MTDAATLLASTDVIGIERAADLMGALLKAPVSTGFVSRCLVRLDAALIAAGFEDALKSALRAADVLGTDETPAPLTGAATSAEGCGNPQLPRRPAIPVPARRRGQRRPGHRRLVRPPRQQPRRQQHMRSPGTPCTATAAAAPSGPASPARKQPVPGHDPTGPAAPRTPGRTSCPLPASARRGLLPGVPSVPWDTRPCKGGVIVA